MKTAISLPDSLFLILDKHASERGLSRSALIAEALKEYLDRHGKESLTEKINAAVAEIDQSDTVLANAGRRALRELEW